MHRKGTKGRVAAARIRGAKTPRALPPGSRLGSAVPAPALTPSSPPPATDEETLLLHELARAEARLTAFFRLYGEAGHRDVRRAQTEVDDLRSRLDRSRARAALLLPVAPATTAGAATVGPRGSRRPEALPAPSPAPVPAPAAAPGPVAVRATAAPEPSAPWGLLPPPSRRFLLSVLRGPRAGRGRALVPA